MPSRVDADRASTPALRPGSTTPLTLLYHPSVENGETLQTTCVTLDATRTTSPWRPMRCRDFRLYHPDILTITAHDVFGQHRRRLAGRHPAKLQGTWMAPPAYLIVLTWDERQGDHSCCGPARTGRRARGHGLDLARKPARASRMRRLIPTTRCSRPSQPPGLPYLGHAAMRRTC